jgi:hypothetical protein
VLDLLFCAKHLFVAAILAGPAASDPISHVLFHDGAVLRARRWMLRLRRSPLSSRFCREGAATGVTTSTGSADVADTRVRHHTSERVLARSENGFAVAADAGWRIARDDGRTNYDGLGLRGARRDGQKPKCECTHCKQELAHIILSFLVRK